MNRLKVYNHELSDKFEFCQIVSEFKHELNNEISQVIAEKLVALREKERENLQTVNIQRFTILLG